MLESWNAHTSPSPEDILKTSFSIIIQSNNETHYIMYDGFWKIQNKKYSSLPWLMPCCYMIWKELNKFQSIKKLGQNAGVG